MSATPAQQQAFVSQYVPVAEAAAQGTGYSPAQLLALFANETGWGTSLPGKNNLASIGPHQNFTSLAAFAHTLNALLTSPRYAQANALAAQGASTETVFQALANAGYDAAGPGESTYGSQVAAIYPTVTQLLPQASQPQPPGYSYLLVPVSTTTQPLPQGEAGPPSLDSYTSPGGSTAPVLSIPSTGSSTVTGSTGGAGHTGSGPAPAPAAGGFEAVLWAAAGATSQGFSLLSIGAWLPQVLIGTGVTLALLWAGLMVAFPRETTQIVQPLVQAGATAAKAAVA